MQQTSAHSQWILHNNNNTYINIKICGLSSEHKWKPDILAIPISIPNIPRRPILKLRIRLFRQSHSSQFTHISTITNPTKTAQLFSKDVCALLPSSINTSVELRAKSIITLRVNKGALKTTLWGLFWGTWLTSAQAAADTSVALSK